MGERGVIKITTRDKTNQLLLKRQYKRQTFRGACASKRDTERDAMLT
jgi:hypothetical protein